MASLFTTMYCMAFKHVFTVYQSVLLAIGVNYKKDQPVCERVTTSNDNNSHVISGCQLCVAEA